MRYLQPAVIPDLARHEPARVVLDLARPERRRIEKQELDFSGAVGKRGHEARPSTAHDSRADDFADDDDLFADLAIPDGGHLRLVEVVAGNIVQQFGNGT